MQTKAGEILTPAVKRSSANKHYNQAVEMLDAGKVLQAEVKRAIYNRDYNEVIKDHWQRDVELFRSKIKKLRKTQNKNAFENFASSIQTQQESVSNFGKLSTGITKQQRQTNKQIEASERAQSQQKISNFGKFSKAATTDLKQRWKQSVQQQQTSISNFGQLTYGLKQQQQQQRLGAASMQPMQLEAGTRSGAAFTATEAQLNAPSRMQLHRERNPELTQLRQQRSDFKRGKTQLSDIQKAGIETRIQQLVEINKVLKANGAGPKLGRPAK
jgi:hypothetical protein